MKALHPGRGTWSQLCTAIAASLLGGCALVGASPTPSTPAPTPTATASPTTSPTEVEPTPEAPPLASLVLADGTEHDGTVGTYCYRESCSDSPFWPTADSLDPVELASAGAQLGVELPAGFEFVAWVARYAARDDYQAETVYPLGSGGSADGTAQIGQATFDAPPSGEWLVEVSLTFADGVGSANYYWLVAVP